MSEATEAKKTSQVETNADKMSQTLTASLRKYSFQIAMAVSAAFLMFAGLFAGTFSLAMILIAGHLFVSGCIIAGINYGRPWMKDFGYGCVVPNAAGYLFAFGGVIGWERWLIASTLLLLLLTTTGMGGLILHSYLLRNEDSPLYSMPLVGGLIKKFVLWRQGNADSNQDKDTV